MLETKSNVDCINAIVEKAIKEIKIANTRAQSAEKMLETIKETVRQEVAKSYQMGFLDGKKSVDSTEGGTERKEDNIKLVLNKN